MPQWLIFFCLFCYIPVCFCLCCFDLSYFYYYYYYLNACFLMRGRKSVDSDGERNEEDLGAVGGGEAVIKIYPVKKEK